MEWAQAKGQLISKGLFVFFNSPKKRTKNFCPSRLGQKLTFSKLFFGRIEDTKISFRPLVFACSLTPDFDEFFFSILKNVYIIIYKSLFRIAERKDEKSEIKNPRFFRGSARS